MRKVCEVITEASVHKTNHVELSLRDVYAAAQTVKSNAKVAANVLHVAKRIPGEESSELRTVDSSLQFNWGTLR